jgi:hypothetical protein
MMKKTMLICVLPLLAAGLFAQGPPRGEGFGGFGGRGEGILGAGPGPRSVVTGAPYSATETVTSQQTLANGNQITRTHTSTVARDSSGRTSTIETVTPPAASGRAPFTIQTIFDPVGGHRYVLNSSTMIAMEEPLPKPRGAAASGTARTPAKERPARPNEATASLGTVVVNGVAATGTQITETMPAGAIGNAQPIQSTRTHWVSSTLQVPVEIKTVDPRFGSTVMELTNIVQAEPSGTLFAVPAGYTVKQGGRGGRGPGGRGPGGDWKGGRPGPPQQ